MRFPWYRVVWNFLWLPLYFVGAVFCFLAILMQRFSLKNALSEWRDMW